MAWIRRSPPDYSFSLSSFYGAGKVGQCYGCLMVNMVMVMVKMVIVHGCQDHPALKREDRLGKDPFAGFGAVVEDIKRSGYSKNQPILLGAF